VFFDGEESFVQWTGSDHTYGSRHQAAQWSLDGTAQRIKALINVDMIGDADLRLVYEQQSTPWLRDLVWDVGVRLGYSDVFADRRPSYIADDHVPFLELGIPALDLIDFEYGRGNSYWHNEQDTMDKLSAQSFAVVLHVVLETLEALADRP
jgi:Zn-dependent M28 family amino/carboxypeptidase